MKCTITFDGSGPDAVVVNRTGLFLTVFYKTEIFTSGAWPEHKLGSQSVLQKCQEWYRQSFEGGLTGHHGHISDRKEARRDLLERIQNIVLYLSLMASESDISMLVNAGVLTRKSKTRARKAVKAA